MRQIEPYLPWLLALIVLLCAYLVIRWLKAKKSDNAENRFILETLRAAIAQKAVFDLKLMDGEHHSGIAAMPVELAGKALVLQTHEKITSDCAGDSVEAYFRVGLEDNAVFYVFDSKISSASSEQGKSGIKLEMPKRLRVEKKRHFLRVQPNPKDILMVGVWPIIPGQRLPRSNADIGQPPISWKSGHDQKDIWIENISGAGLALTFALSGPDAAPPFNISQGRQLLCLIVCRILESAPHPVIFWSADEIKNIRKSGASLTLGLEFTNVAIQEPGSPEIHWTHASPWRGVKPILQWVQRIDRSQN